MRVLLLAALTFPLRSSRRSLSLLLNLWFFFFTLKYLVIFPGTEDVLVEHEKKFLQVMPMQCFCLSPSNPKHRAGKLPGEPHT